MKASSIFTILDLAWNARKKGEIFNPVFVSPPGIGKTEIIQQWAVSRNLPFLVFTSALYEAPDVKGFPIVKVNEAGRQQQTTAIPDFWPDQTSWPNGGVVILEELNRGTTSIMNCIMPLGDKRRGFDGYRLPDNVILCGAINHESELYDVNTMDPALKDRFEFFEVKYDKKTFQEFMKLKNWNENVQMAVEANILSYTKPEDLGEGTGTKYNSPRTWSKLNAALLAGTPKDLELDVYESILGPMMGRAFFQFMNDEQPVLYRDICKNPKQAFSKLQKFSDPANYKSGHVSLTIKDIVENKDIPDDLLVQVILNIPADAGVALVSDLTYNRKEASDSILNRIVDNFPEVRKYLRSVLIK